mmetsp:Transcript_24830/g.76586  ORF Transcript_24830/g.76586 Transcript_24830/m.76586 type:complete len:239 (+) Transcript_24830:63-779(+)
MGKRASLQFSVTRATAAFRSFFRPRCARVESFRLAAGEAKLSNTVRKNKEWPTTTIVSSSARRSRSRKAWSRSVTARAPSGPHQSSSASLTSTLIVPRTIGARAFDGATLRARRTTRRSISDPVVPRMESKPPTGKHSSRHAGTSTTPPPFALKQGWSRKATRHVCSALVKGEQYTIVARSHARRSSPSRGAARMRCASASACATPSAVSAWSNFPNMPRGSRFACASFHWLSPWRRK